MDVNKSELAQYLMHVRSRSSAFSKQDFKMIFTKLYYILIDLDDLSLPAFKQYENRSVSSAQLGQICELLESLSDDKLGKGLEQKLLVSILEVTMGNLLELSNKKLEYVMDIFARYYYKGGVEDTDESVLQSDFVLDRLTKCFDLKTLKRTV
tara:strand:+ start:128 stop:583 length:456 start_codon:yes stop_codon:yes gene_type:complete